MNRVLARAPNWIGDAVMSLGGLRELRRIVEGSHLAIAAKPWVAGIYEEAGIADEVIHLGGGATSAHRTLRNGHFDLAVLFQNAFSAALAARLARIPKVVGYATDGRRLLLSHAFERSPDHKREHQSRYYMRISRAVEQVLRGSSSVDVDRPDTSLKATAETSLKARDSLVAMGFEAGTRLACLNPGATNSRAKQWLPERFAEVADVLASRFGMRTAIIGSEGDLETANKVAEMIDGPPAIVLAGQTDIRTLIGLLSHSSLLVSNDTGPAHISAALGVPTVTIFGPTEQFSTHPLGVASVTASHPVECAPCMLKDCPIDHRCMTRLESSEVMTAVEEALGLGARAS